MASARDELAFDWRGTDRREPAVDVIEDGGCSGWIRFVGNEEMEGILNKPNDGVEVVARRDERRGDEDVDRARLGEG